MAETLSNEQDLDEETRVLAWRRRQLRSMHDQHGHSFTSAQVHVLSEGACDLHEAAAILAAGCTVPTAFAILS